MTPPPAKIANEPFVEGSRVRVRTDGRSGTVKKFWIARRDGGGADPHGGRKYLVDLDPGGFLEYFTRRQLEAAPAEEAAP